MFELPPGFTPASQLQLYESYGDGVSGTLRSSDFPTEPESFFVQRQDIHPGALLPWRTLAVYRSLEAAAAAAVRGEEEAANTPCSSANLETGEIIPDAEQPVSIFRVVTLGDLLRKGPEVVWHAVFSLATSDHAWDISTELGSGEKLALVAEFIDGEIGPEAVRPLDFDAPDKGEAHGA